MADATAVGRELNSKDLGDDFGIVQFATAIYYVAENEGGLTLSIWRIGSACGEASAKWRTVDGSAKAGIQYEAASGEVSFSDGENEKTFHIKLLPDDLWHATNEFKVELHDQKNCILGAYLHTCRVKILDETLFPSDKYTAEQLCDDEAIQEISDFGLFMEFAKLNFGQPGIRWRTVVTIAGDQLPNGNLLLQTWMAIYMVDVVFNVHESEKELKFFTNRSSEAVLVACLYAFPVVILHFWDYCKIQMDISGHTLAYLNQSIVRKYMNYSEEARSQVDSGRIQVAVNDDIKDLTSGYIAVLDTLKNLGKVLVLVLFTLHSNPGAWWVVALMPTLMLSYVLVRQFVCGEGREEAKEAKKSVHNLIGETVNLYRLVADYQMRPKMNELVAEKVSKLRRLKIQENAQELNDKYFPTWLGNLFVGIYIWVKAPVVLGKTPGDLSLGQFLATISIIRDTAGAFSILWSVHLTLMAAYDPLKDLTFLFNMKTDVPALMQSARATYEESLKARARKTSAAKLSEARQKSKSIPACDTLQLSLEGVNFRYLGAPQPLIAKATITVEQGKLVAVGGVDNSGKATLLQLVGRSRFPTDGRIFVPGHLRIHQVANTPLLFQSWTPMMNLTFGVQGEQVDRDRIETVVKALGMTKTLDLLSKDPAFTEDGLLQHNSSLLATPPLSARTPLLQVCGCGSDTRDVEVDEESGVKPQKKINASADTRHWHEILCNSEKAKLCLARGFIANAEVLILHKPLGGFQPESRAKIKTAMSLHVKNRGIGMPEMSTSSRRPRTIFYSMSDPKDCDDVADVKWEISQQHLRNIELRGS